MWILGKLKWIAIKVAAAAAIAFCLWQKGKKDQRDELKKADLERALNREQRQTKKRTEDEWNDFVEKNKGR